MAAIRASVPVLIPPLRLAGDLRAPDDAKGLVIFAHGSGSSRFSPRNQEVARALNEAGLATLLLDLLTEDEARNRANVFDIDLLAERLTQAIDWARSEPALAALPIGLFGASTGAAAALTAAASRPQAVAAVVSRGGRPDLADAALDQVTAPTLLIVGGRDEPVIAWNQAAQRRLGGPSRLEIVPGATHLFEEPGTLEEVIELALDWFSERLGAEVWAEP
ncbi:dienelactone hydrolase family protein [Phenylobacterium sp.]|uniref:dienelactone hydrolase family protein n=1 Tax=Phenylobacterium sp. TaxID=1871053 RepID=UPI00271EB682|nr:alpha/beta family hydrolase [Phenylobacterium sp.]MDO8379722.1 alpha/beta hydrolase [Phenylobacterium sp.]